MNRYLLFAGNDDTMGGWQDLLGSFGELADIKVCLHLEEDLTRQYLFNDTLYLWYEIVDLTTGEVVKGRQPEENAIP